MQSQEAPQVLKTSAKEELRKEVPKEDKSGKEKIPSPVSSHANISHASSGSPSNIEPERNKNDNNDQNWVHKFLYDPTAVFTALLFLATIALWWATILLFRAAKTTANQQLRAYVFASVTNEGNLSPNKNGLLCAPIIIKNYGQTPAYKLKSSIYIHPHLLPLTEDLSPNMIEGGSIGSLAPGQEFRTYPSLLKPLTNGITEGIKRGEAAIHVWGLIEYVDIFGVKQTTQFRLLSAGEDFSKGELAYCEDGNDAT